MFHKPHWLLLFVLLLLIPSTALLALPPMAVDDSASTPVNTPITINVVANDADPEDNLVPSSAQSVLGAANGTLMNNGDGTFTYTPATDFVGTDGFDYDVCDALLECASAHVTIEVIDLPPDCSGASPSANMLWPPNHKGVPITINGVIDPEGEVVSIMITGITSNEDEGGDGASIVDTDTAMVPAERNGNGNGRTYIIDFTAEDPIGGTCEGTVTVEVPHDQRGGNSANNGAMSGDEPGDFGCEHPGNYCNAPGHNQEAPGDFGCDGPGNACNAPGHNKGGDDSEPAMTSSQQNSSSGQSANRGNGNNGNNGNRGNGNSGNNGNNGNNRGRGPKK